MVNIYDKLKNLFDNLPTAWNYYYISTDFPLDRMQDSIDYVWKFFDYGAKANACVDIVNNGEMQLRTMHSVCLFFIGAYIQNIIDPNLSIYSMTNQRFAFSYLWSLVALAHDFGYLYENDSLTISEIKESKVNRTIWYRQNIYRKSKIPIQHCAPGIPILRCTYNNKYIRLKCSEELKNDIDCEFPCRNNLKMSNGTTIDGNWYGYILKSNYFKYRIEQHHTLDHGIIGADKLYSDLLSNYKSAYNSSKDRYNNYSNFTYQNRAFSCEQFPVFAYIADCISCHNMYMCNDDICSRNTYYKYNLDDLLPENYRKISYDENPLLYVLCLSDTLEPMKRFWNTESEINILKRINFEYNHESRCVSISIDKSVAEGENGKKYIKDIKELELWMEISPKIIIV